MQNIFIRTKPDVILHSLITAVTYTEVCAGKWHVILACRDFLKAERMARKAGLSKEDYTVMHLDLSSMESVRQFVDNFRWGSFHELQGYESSQRRNRTCDRNRQCNMGLGAWHYALSGKISRYLDDQSSWPLCQLYTIPAAKGCGYTSA